MSICKDYTKTLLERLNKKSINYPQIKSGCFSQKTQATPTDSSTSQIRQVRQFFQSFQTNIATYHQPVTIIEKKSIRRCLFYQLSRLNLGSNLKTESKLSSEKRENRESKERRRLVTLPISIGSVDEQKLSLKKSYVRDVQPWVSVKKMEAKIEVFSRVGSKQQLQRYKSSKAF